jgi:sirohydrochlorin ferrochelatase
MELAEPSIGAAFDRCIERGARLLVIHPYFLLPGRHWKRDIPALAAEAAARHPGVPFLVTAPLGLHPLMAEIMSQRIEYCLSRLRGDAGPCNVCSERDTCQLDAK